MDTKLTVGNISPFHSEGRVSHCREGKVDLYRYALYQKIVMLDMMLITKMW